MPEEQRISSNLVNTGTILVLFAVALAANYFQFYTLSVFMLFLSVFMLFSRLWGNRSMDHVKLSIFANNSRVFPGSALEVHYIVENNKFLPLTWLELYQKAPDNHCVEPDSSFVKDTMEISNEVGAEIEVYKRKFTWILWHERLEWKTKYQAVCRGVYTISNVQVFSGDGFGLTAVKKRYKLAKAVTFLVYPRLIEVKTELFFRSYYEASSSSRGYMEDHTLLKSSKNYIAGDSLKKINWRMVAKTGKMISNVYEEITPKASFFILDLESFEGKTEGIEILEKMLSITASLFVRLTERDMSCGLAIPAINEGQGIYLYPGKDTAFVEQCLSHLARISYNGEKTSFDLETLFKTKKTMGQVYLLANSAETLSCPAILEGMASGSLNFIFHKPLAYGQYFENKVYTFAEIEGAAYGR